MIKWNSMFLTTSYYDFSLAIVSQTIFMLANSLGHYFYMSQIWDTATDERDRSVLLFCRLFRAIIEKSYF